MINSVKRALYALIDAGVVTMRAVMKYVFRLCPVKKDKIVFVNFNGKGFGCNPKYIALEILKQKLPYDLVWLVDNMNEDLPDGIRPARFGQLSGLYETATAKVIITNVKNDLYLVKKKEQYLIETWHGSYGFKLLEQDAGDALTPKYRKESQRNSAITDLFLSNSRMLSQCYRRAFWCECEIMECGFPRNDMLFQPDETVEQRVRDYFGFGPDEKIAIYAPTFRDDGSTEAYMLDCDAVLDALKDSGDWRLLIRMHPNVRNCESLFTYTDRVINATPYPDMQELLLVSDILITDYSCSVFEFAITGKPSYIYASDVEEYQKMRGLNREFFQMPYKACRTTEALVAQLREYNAQTAAEKARQFIEFYGCVDDGHAAQRVVERINSVTNI